MCGVGVEIKYMNITERNQDLRNSSKRCCSGCQLARWLLEPVVESRAGRKGLNQTASGRSHHIRSISDGLD